MICGTAALHACQVPVRLIDHGPPVVLVELPGGRDGVDDAGVGDEHVETAELGDAFVEPALEGVVVADVGGERNGPPVQILHLAYRLGEVVGRGGGVGYGVHRSSKIGNDDVRTLPGQPERVRAALPPCGAGNERYLAFDSSWHVVLLLLLDLLLRSTADGQCHADDTAGLVGGRDSGALLSRPRPTGRLQ